MCPVSGYCDVCSSSYEYIPTYRRMKRRVHCVYISVALRSTYISCLGIFPLLRSVTASPLTVSQSHHRRLPHENGSKNPDHNDRTTERHHDTTTMIPSSSSPSHQRYQRPTSPSFICLSTTTFICGDVEITPLRLLSMIFYQ